MRRVFGCQVSLLRGGGGRVLVDARPEPGPITGRLHLFYAPTTDLRDVELLLRFGDSRVRVGPTDRFADHIEP